MNDLTILNAKTKQFLENPKVETAHTILDECNHVPDLALDLNTFFLAIFPHSVSLFLNKAKLLTNLNRYEEACDMYETILKTPHVLSYENSRMVLKEEKKLFPHLLDRYNYYNEEKVKEITNNLKYNILPLFTLTITTCKRYELFEQTMNTFLNCCTDILKISRFLCIDDNSSEEDRKKMKEKYPFFEFYFKKKEEKGHPQSMNLIRNLVKTPYIFHLEDDWKFFIKRNYISDCFEILSTSDFVKQCLVNKNYSETIQDNILGGFEIVNDIGRYYLHEYCETEEQKTKFIERHGSGSSCNYWPHFSLRPSLFKRSVLTELGPFDEKIAHFEMDYSYKYHRKGFRSAFLEGQYCVHIGRLTSERFDNGKLNAYVLNGEEQFRDKTNNTDKPVIFYSHGEGLDKTALNTGDKGVSDFSTENNFLGSTGDGKKEFSDGLQMRTFIVNLDRRRDRWDKLDKKEISFLNPQRFLAIDGTKLIPTEQLQRIFDNNDYNMREGMVGCALSHIQLCINLLKSEDCDKFCILEDDVTFVPNFSEKLSFVLQTLPSNWDLCYLGHHIWDKYKTALTYDKTLFPTLEKWNTKTSLERSVGGTIGYLISKKGAKLLLEFINRYGMTNGIDTVQQKAANIMNVYYCTPHLVYSEYYSLQNNTDSDIQKDYRSLTIPIEERLENERKIYKNLIELNEEQNDYSSVLQELKTGKSVLYQVRNVNNLSRIHSCNYPWYQIGPHHILFSPVIPDGEKRYFSRLKINGEFDISDAILYKETGFSVIVPFGEMKHVYEAVKQLGISPQSDYPFDVIDEGKVEIFVDIVLKILEMNNEELKEFVRTFCKPINSVGTLRNYLGLTFPHDDIKTLESNYYLRFQNLVRDIKSGKQILFISAIRWGGVDKETIEKFVKKIKMCNSSVKLLIINGEIENSEDVRIEKVSYPLQFQIEKWPRDKIIYDQNVFRTEIITPISNFVKGVAIPL